MKKVRKRSEKGPKIQKNGKKSKKRIKILTLERNLETKNCHFRSNVDGALVFFLKK